MVFCGCTTHFHPELILCFQHKWGSHNGFQRTRGVLRILANLISDLWKRKGMKLLQDHSLFPTSEKSISSKDLYEAFLRYDDKSMITGFQAILKTMERYTSSGDICIATKSDGGFSNFRMGVGVKIGEIIDESLYLLNPTAFPKPAREEEKSQVAQNDLFSDPTVTQST